MTQSEIRENIPIFILDRFSEYGKTSATNQLKGMNMAGEYEHLRHVNIPKATPKAAAPTAKPAPRFVQVDVKAIKAAAFAEGFRAATQRVAIVAALPEAKGREPDLLKLLGSNSFAHLSATQFVTSWRAAMAKQGVASWPSVIAKLNDRNGL